MTSSELILSYQKPKFQKIIHFFSSLVVIASFAGCGQKNDRSLNAETQATFDVDQPIAAEATIVDSSTRIDGIGNIRKLYVMKACILDRALQTPQQDLEFSVSVEGISFQRVTDIKGCFTWNESVEYDVKKQETYVVIERAITAISGHSGTVSLKLAVNPWGSAVDVKDLRIFPGFTTNGAKAIYKKTTEALQEASDAQKAQIQYQVVADNTLAQKTQANSTVYLSSLSFEWLRGQTTSYRLSPSLALNMSLKYNLTLAPHLLRKGISGNNIDEVMQAGAIKVSMVILKDSHDSQTIKNSDILSTAEKIYHVVDGVSVEEVAFDFDDIAALNSSTYLLVTLSPLDDAPSDAKFEEVTYKGILDGFPELQMSSIFHRELTANARILHQNYRQHQKDVAFKAQRPLDSFTHVSGFTEIKEAKISYAQMGYPARAEAVDFKLQTRSYFEGDQQNIDPVLAKVLCLKYFGVDDSRFQNATTRSYQDQCKSNPVAHLNISGRDFIESIPEPSVERVHGPQYIDIDVGATFEKAKTSSSDDGYKFSSSFSMGATVGADVNPLPKIPILSDVIGFTLNLYAKLSFGYDRFYTTGVTKTQTTRTSTSTTLNRKAQAEVSRFIFEASYRKCILVYPHQDTVENLRKSGLNPLKGMYLCSEDVKTGPRTEVYFLVKELVSTSVFTDSRSSGETTWNMLIRGQRTFDLFSAIISQKDLVLQISKMPEDPDLTDMKDNYITQEYPGAL